MDNSKHINFNYKYYINENDNELNMITELQNITFLQYLEGIFMKIFQDYKSMTIAVLETK